MPGRGPQTFKKRQKEQERKERQQQKMARRLARKDGNASSAATDHDKAGDDIAEQNPDTETVETDADVL